MVRPPDFSPRERPLSPMGVSQSVVRPHHVILKAVACGVIANMNYVLSTPPGLYLMADLIGWGALNFAVFETRPCPLRVISEALAAVQGNDN